MAILVDLTRLLATLNGAGLQESNPALYQVLSQLITFDQQVQIAFDASISENSSDITSLLLQTFLTSTDETILLTNSRELIAGTSITFDDSISGRRTINSTGGLSTAQVSTRVLHRV